MLGQVILGKYTVTRPLDEGGMSKLYLARQAEPARDVVVKMLKDSLRTIPKVVEHFRREIYITSRFQHPNAVACYDFSTKDPAGAVLVMEYLRGVDLNTLLLREGRFSPERTGRLLAQLCDVLQAAHEQGIVHRDIKPGNLMLLFPGTPHETLKLMDFGLAKMNSMLYISPEDLVDFNLPPASGTPEYISPEMVRGNDLDGRADLYSVGVLLYEMLSGRRPFMHGNVEKLMLAHAGDRPPSFAAIGYPGLVSPALEAVIMSCLAKYPEDRPRTAWELALAFEKALGRRITASRTPVGQTASGVQPAVGSGSRSARSTCIRPAVSAAVRAAAAAKAQAAATAPEPPPATRHAFCQTVEASMPEAMALVKLKGFIYDLGGEVIESVPGMIRVRLVERSVEKKGSGLFRWMSGGGGRQASVLGTVQATDIELHMERLDPSQASKLTITLIMNPSGGLATADWRNRCMQIGRNLQAYLMGR
jgi:serine/threonine-protein kinase